MPIFIWKGINKRGAIKKGEVEADSVDGVRNILQQHGITPKKIKQKPKDLFENVAMMQPKVTPKDVVIFTRQFATMIDAGLPLVQCLEILFSQEENKTFKMIIKQVKDDVEAGSTFADALAKHPNVFDELYSNLVAAGESGGILDIILNRLAEYIEKTEQLKRKIKGAMTYPAVVVCVAILVVAVILIFVIPVFQKMFSGFGHALPMPTQIVIDMSDFLKSYIIWIIIGVMILGFIWKKILSTEKGRYEFDKFILYAPIFGDLLRKVAVARFTKTLGTMVGAGVPILEALEIVAKTAGNKRVEAALVDTRIGISEGLPIAEPLEDSGIFPNMVVQMIGIGESVGALDSMLMKIAEFYEDEVDTAVDALTAMIEPLLMVFLGGAVGGLVVSMYLPVFKMAGAVG